MPWKITRYPALAGVHSLGEGLVTFDATGCVTVDDEATAQKALEFPGVFTVEDLSAAAPAEEDAAAGGGAEASASAHDEEESHSRRRPSSGSRRGED